MTLEKKVVRVDEGNHVVRLSLAMGYTIISGSRIGHTAVRCGLYDVALFGLSYSVLRNICC